MDTNPEKLSTENGTHVQYTRSVTGRKRGDGSRRIVTDCRVVATRHESFSTGHTGSHVAKRDSGSVLQVVYTLKKFQVVNYTPTLKKLSDRDDPRRVAKLARTATIRDSSWRTVTAVKQSYADDEFVITRSKKAQKRMKCGDISRSKKQAARNFRLTTQAAKTNKIHK